MPKRYTVFASERDPYEQPLEPFSTPEVYMEDGSRWVAARNLIQAQDQLRLVQLCGLATKTDETHVKEALTAFDYWNQPGIQTSLGVTPWTWDNEEEEV